MAEVGAILLLVSLPHTVASSLRILVYDRQNPEIWSWKESIRQARDALGVNFRQSDWMITSSLE